MIIPWQDLDPETLDNLCYAKAPIMVNMNVHLPIKSPM